MQSGRKTCISKELRAKIRSVLGALGKLRKATIVFVMFIYPSFRPSAWNNSVLIGRIFHDILDLSIFKNL
jgi:hypothetical protein